MLTRFNALVLPFFAALLLLIVAGSASADGMWGVEASQDQSSITVTGPEGPHTPPKSLFPLYAGDTLTETLSANPTGGGSNASGQECTLDSVTYSYKNVVMTYSTNDGAQTSSTNIGSASINGGNPATLTASFPVPGYYTISYTIHMDYTSKTCGDSSAETSAGISFAVQAGDFDFTLTPTYLVVPSGGNATTVATITSYNGFHNAVGFSRGGEIIPPGFTVSGSGTPPANGSVDTPISVSVDKSFPFSMDKTPVSINVRGRSQVGSVILAHDHPLSVLVNFVWITGPYDNSKHKGATGPEPNKRNPDGSITTDSILSYTTDDYGAPQSDPWRTTSALAAKNTAGLGLVYDWSAGYGVLNYSVYSTDHASYQVNQSDSPATGNSPFRTTTATVSAAGVGSNSYSIRWHHQYEGWVKDTTVFAQPLRVPKSPSSFEGLPIVGSGTSNVKAVYPVYDVDIDGLVQAGILVAAATIGLYEKNPIYAGLVAIMPIELDKLNEEVADATHRTRYPNPANIFALGVSKPGQILYKDIDGTAFDIVQRYNLPAHPDYLRLEQMAGRFTMLSTKLSVPYKNTTFTCDEYSAQGYVGPHSTTRLIFDATDPDGVYDVGVFQLNSRDPFSY